MSAGNSGLFTNDQMLFTKVFTNVVVQTFSETAFLQMAIKNIFGVVTFKGNGTQISFSINGAPPAPLDSAYINLATGDSVTMIALDGTINVTIDASEGSFKMMAIQ